MKNLKRMKKLSAILALIFLIQQVVVMPAGYADMTAEDLQVPVTGDAQPVAPEDNPPVGSSDSSGYPPSGGDLFVRLDSSAEETNGTAAIAEEETTAAEASDSPRQETTENAPAPGNPDTPGDKTEASSESDMTGADTGSGTASTEDQTEIDPEVISAPIEDTTPDPYFIERNTTTDVEMDISPENVRTSLTRSGQPDWWGLSSAGAVTLTGRTARLTFLVGDKFKYYMQAGDEIRVQVWHTEPAWNNYIGFETNTVSMAMTPVPGSSDLYELVFDLPDVPAGTVFHWDLFLLRPSAQAQWGYVYAGIGHSGLFTAPSTPQATPQFDAASGALISATLDAGRKIAIDWFTGEAKITYPDETVVNYRGIIPNVNPDPSVYEEISVPMPDGSNQLFFAERTRIDYPNGSSILTLPLSNVWVYRDNSGRILNISVYSQMQSGSTSRWYLGDFVNSMQFLAALGTPIDPTWVDEYVAQAQNVRDSAEQFLNPGSPEATAIEQWLLQQEDWLRRLGLIP